MADPTYDVATQYDNNDIFAIFLSGQLKDGSSWGGLKIQGTLGVTGEVEIKNDTGNAIPVNQGYSSPANDGVYTKSNSSGALTPSAPQQATIGATTTQAVAAFNNRAGLIMINLSPNTIYLGLGVNAELQKGIVLKPNGGYWRMTQYDHTTLAINAIATVAGSLIAIQEFSN